MKFVPILSVYTLALATVISADHGQFEHNSVAPAHIEAPAHEPAHHWAARESREPHRVHSCDASHYDEHTHVEAAVHKRIHHRGAREAREHEGATHAESPAHKPIRRWGAREAREHKALPQVEMKPTATRHSARAAGKPSNHASHDSFKDKKTDEKRPAHHWAAREAREYSDHPKHHELKPTGVYHRTTHEARQHEAVTHTKDPANKSTHHRAAQEAREHAEHPEIKPASVHHWARAMFGKKHITKPDSSKAGGHHFARDAAREPMHKGGGGAVAGKPGHHFVRDAKRARPAGGNPYADTPFTLGSAISSIRDILTGGTDIPNTCNRCVVAMQIGQSLAQQSSTNDFSDAVVGLCKQVRYKSNFGCTSAFGPGKVESYMQSLRNADMQQDGKSFCKDYFNAC